MHADRPTEALNTVRAIAILGTGLIGASAGLALRAQGFAGSILGWDPSPQALAAAEARGAVDRPAHPHPTGEEAAFSITRQADIILLAGPVLTIAEWLERLAPLLTAGQLVTDAGSVKGFLVDRAGALYNGVRADGGAQPSWLPGHPMAGKEHAGAAYADAALFDGAAWLFTPAAHGEDATEPEHPLAPVWQQWTRRMGAHPVPLTVQRHDTLCAAVSHLPQMLATALAATLAESLAPELDDRTLQQTGGRALREMTRLGASPYSMWRDIALTNQPALAAALLTLEQQLAHLRENLKTPGLRNLFEEANAFREKLTGPPRGAGTP